MGGSVFFVAILLVGVVAAVVLGTPFLLIPAIIIALGFIAAGPVLAALRGSSVAQRDPGPEVPSSSDASYDPTSTPR